MNQEEIKHKVALLLKKISNPGMGIGKELFDAVIGIVPQATIEAVIVDSISNPTKVLVTPRNDEDYHSACHFPGSFIRHGETFTERLERLVVAELGVTVKKYKDTDVKYDLLKNGKHTIGFYFLVEISDNSSVAHEWVNDIPKNLVAHHAEFLKNYLGWKP